MRATPNSDDWNACALFEHHVIGADRLHRGQRFVDGGQRGLADGGLRRGFGGLAEGVLFGPLQPHDGRVLQAGQPAQPRLPPVLHAHQHLLGLAVVLGAALAEGHQQHLAPPQHVELLGQRAIADVLQVMHRVEPVGMGRVAGDQHEIAVRQRRGIPLQILRLDRFAVLVDAEEADVEVVARIFEVVGIAAEIGDLLLRREDQPHVGVSLVAVELVQPAAVERDDVAAESGLLERLLFDVDHGGPPQLFGLGRVGGRLDRGVDPLGDVLDAHQHVELRVGALQFLVAGAGVEAGVQQVAVLAAQFLQRPAPT